jgi:asparagine N-glycosylation enzyme membrane subunit Stt3
MAPSGTTYNLPRLAKAAFVVAILLGSAGLTAWVWSLPQSLPAARDWGERQVNAFAAARIRQATQQQGAPGAAQTTADIETWKQENKALAERIVQKAEQRYRDQFTYQAPDGGEHVYLGDTDSYFWLHFARKLLRIGQLCDPGEGQRCLDAHGHGPLAYPFSLHVYAIAAIHLLATTINPDYPLAESARLLLVIVATLGVLPAFFIGRRVAGILGGMIAASTFALHPLVLERGLGGDNDVWNLVMPLFLVWAASEALSGGLWRRITLAILAGAIAGIHATVWQGWAFAYIIVTAGILGYLILHAVNAVIESRSLRVWHSAGVQGAAQALIIFYVAAGLFVTLAGAGYSYTTIPLKALNTLVEPLFDAGTRPAATMAWPNVLGTVSELQRSDLTVIANNLGGTGFMLIGLVGLLLAFFPRDKWRLWHYVLLSVGVGWYVNALFIEPPDGRLALALVVAAPPLAAVILNFVERRKPDPTHGLAVIILLWFIAALFVSYGGIRFVLFLAPPFSLALAAGVGRAFQWLQGLSEAWLGRFRTIVDAVAFLLLATVLVAPVSKGMATARQYFPMVNDAWWDSLTALRDESDPRSIITVWWDHGHWAKYIADRRVTADGTSLRTNLPHWMAKALTTPDPRESLGVLRMLDCASDVTPLPEGAHGAYGTIKATGRDDLAAYSIVAGLVVRNRAQAEAYLTERRFSASERQRILATSHCDPPEAYLVLSTSLLRKIRRLIGLGHQDPRRNELAKRLKDMDASEATDWLAAEFGYTRAEAQALYRRVEAQTGRPIADFLDRAWSSCRARGDDGTMVCPFSLRTKEGSMRGLFRYRPGHWSKANFEFDPAKQKSKKFVNGPPGLILVAGDDRLAQIVPEHPIHPRIAVLLDPAKQKIFIGTPNVLRSMLVQLVVLDGRYAKGFVKRDERTAQSGEGVSTWRINWAEAAKAMP